MQIIIICLIFDFKEGNTPQWNYVAFPHSIYLLVNITDRKNRDFGIANVTVLVILAAICSVIFYHIAISSRAYLTFVADDFYYYFLPAKNLVTKGISSFDGITFTNGYHPLWMIYISLLYLLSGGSEQIFFALLAITCALSCYSTFRLLWKLATMHFPDNPAMPSSILLTMAAVIGLVFLGMEITLTIPLYAYFLFRLSRLNTEKMIEPRNAISIGFIASLLILSRLDSSIMVCIFLILFWLYSQKTTRDKLFFYFYFAIGGIVLPLYLLSNYYWFGHLMTVSSAAKTLKTEHGINFAVLKNIAFDPYGIGGLLLAPLAVASILFLKNFKRMTAFKLVSLLVAIFPIAYYLILLYETDWGFVQWYLYPLPLCFFISSGILGGLLFQRLSERRSIIIKNIFLSLSIVIMMFFGVRQVQRLISGWNHPNTVYAIATDMLPFVQSHPGIYAMGDLAGLTSYILDVPIIQLEGLNADFRMYDHIKAEDTINNVLREYHVNYLIESSDKYSFSHHDGCYDIEEPHTGQAGALSKKMRGKICAEPLYEHHSENLNGYELRTYIFSLTP